MPPVISPVFAPAVTAGLCFLVSWRLWRRKKVAENGHWGGALAFSLGYFVCHVTLLAWPSFPPVKSIDWIPYLGVLAGIAGLMQRHWGKRWYFTWPVRLTVSAIFAGLVLRSYVLNMWTTTQAVLSIAFLSVATSVLWDTLERLAERRTGASLPLCLWLLCVASSSVYVMAHTASIAQLAGGLAAVCGAAVVLAWWAPGLSLEKGAVAVFAPLFMALLWNAHFYADVLVWHVFQLPIPIAATTVLYLAPFALWFGERRPIYYATPWKAALWRLLIIAVPLGLALGLAAYGMQSFEVEEYYY